MPRRGRCHPAFYGRQPPARAIRAVKAARGYLKANE